MDKWYVLPIDNTRNNGLPEAVEIWIGNDICLLGVSENDTCQGVSQDTLDRLEFACTAVNHHDRLVEALKELRDRACSVCCYGDESGTGICGHEDCSAVNKAKALLAEIGGGE